MQLYHLFERDHFAFSPDEGAELRKLVVNKIRLDVKFGVKYFFRMCLFVRHRHPYNMLILA